MAAENVNVWYNVYHQAAWGNYIGTYMFLAAVAAGSIGAATLPRLFGRDTLKDIELPAIVVGLASLVVLSLILIYDLGRPERFVNLFVYLPGRIGSSPMSMAVALFSLLGLGSLIWGASVYTDNEQGAMYGAWASLVLAILTMYVNGLELAAVQSRALWSQGAVLPVLYLATAMAAGLSVAVLIGLARRIDTEPLRELGSYMTWSLVLALFTYGVYFDTVAYQGQNAAYELGILLSSSLPITIGVILGTVVPLLLLIGALKLDMGKQRSTLSGAAGISAVLVLIGVWAFRVSIVAAGYQAQILW